MRIPVVLSIQGRQSYMEQEPETIELVTDGFLEYRNGGWELEYEETELTGLQGATTNFRVEQGSVTLTRSGTLHSQMVFREGVKHESLYQMEFGALMIGVCATRVWAQIGPEGGIIDLVYDIEIEQSTSGQIDYHLIIQPK
ncbi:MAG: DUF1934 domain-containing protein [Oscillospiraceae bacterium]|nr:DUF1934 domain-containing protein [Oscillospiraceae bacterium]